MNITNPKVTVFFLAYLPQFTDPDFGSLHGQMMILGALFIVATLMIFGSIAWFAGLLSEFLRGSNRTQRVINWIVAIIFICLAIRLLMVTH